MSKQQEQQPVKNLLDMRSSFHMAAHLSDIGAAVIRPVFFAGQGTRAFGKETLIAFLAMPVIASGAHSPAILAYWKAWTLLVLLRKLTANRQEHTDFWGRRWVARLLTLGLLPDNTALGMIEPLLTLLAAYEIADWSLPLSKLLTFAAASLAIQRALMAEVSRRQREARHNALIEAQRYR